MGHPLFSPNLPRPTARTRMPNTLRLLIAASAPKRCTPRLLRVAFDANEVLVGFLRRCSLKSKSKIFSDFPSLAPGPPLM